MLLLGPKLRETSLSSPFPSRCLHQSLTFSRPCLFLPKTIITSPFPSGASVGQAHHIEYSPILVSNGRLETDLAKFGREK